MKTMGTALIALAFIAATTATALADGWSLGSLNPFGAKKDEPPEKKSSSSSSGPTIPQLDRKAHTPPPPPAQPSMLSKIGAAPGNMWAKTKSVLAPSPKPAAPFLGTQNKKPDSTGSSWNPFASKQPPPPPRPKTASDFIGLPRPSF